jgi:hypothetical protein
MSETTTKLDPQSQELAAAADRIKTDLSAGADAVVPTGSENAPPPRVDPFSARKSIFAKSQARHEEESRMVRESNPGLDEMVRRMEAEAAGGGDTAVGAAGASAQGQDLARQPVAKQGEGEYVQLQYQGRTVQVSRSDIQRAGSEDLYLRRREMADQAASLALEAAEMARRKAELEAEQRKLAELQADARRPTAAGQDGPANWTGDAPVTANPATGVVGNQGADLTERAKQLAAMIYSGDPQDAEKAVLEILQAAIRAGRSVDPEQVADLAVARLNARAQPVGTTGQPTPEPVIDPVWQRTVEEINRLTLRDYPDVVNDEVKRQEAYAELQRLSALPQNRDRLAVDLALDACEAIRSKTTTPRAAVIEAKRGLPPTPSAGGAAPEAPESRVLSDKDYVQMLAERRRGRSGV